VTNNTKIQTNLVTNNTIYLLQNAQYIGKGYYAKLSCIIPTLSELIPLMRHISDIKAYKSTLYYTLGCNYL
jgi:hypothetical protein